MSIFSCFFIFLKYDRANNGSSPGIIMSGLLYLGGGFSVFPGRAPSTRAFLLVTMHIKFNHNLVYYGSYSFH